LDDSYPLTVSHGSDCTCVDEMACTYVLRGMCILVHTDADTVTGVELLVSI
jgi:hypothetical protein